MSKTIYRYGNEYFNLMPKPNIKLIDYDQKKKFI